MKKPALYLIIFSLFLLNITLLIFSRLEKFKNSNQISILNTRIQIEQESYESLKDRMFTSLLYEGSEINNFKIENDHNKYLILRYPKLACNTCMDSILVIFSKLYTDREMKNAILLIDGSNEQYFYEIKRFYKFTIPIIIETDTNDQILPLDELNAPYFFIIDENYKCHMIYIPEKGKNEDIKRYILLTKKSIF